MRDTSVTNDFLVTKRRPFQFTEGWAGAPSIPWKTVTFPAREPDSSFSKLKELKQFELDDSGVNGSESTTEYWIARSTERQEISRRMNLRSEFAEWKSANCSSWKPLRILLSEWLCLLASSPDSCTAGWLLYALRSTRE